MSRRQHSGCANGRGGKLYWARRKAFKHHRSEFMRRGTGRILIYAALRFPQFLPRQTCIFYTLPTALEQPGEYKRQTRVHELFVSGRLWREAVTGKLYHSCFQSLCHKPYAVARWPLFLQYIVNFGESDQTSIMQDKGCILAAVWLLCFCSGFNTKAVHCERLSHWGMQISEKGVLWWQIWGWEGEEGMAGPQVRNHGPATWKCTWAKNPTR